MKRTIIFILAMLLCMTFCFGCNFKTEAEVETEPTETIVEETTVPEETEEVTTEPVIETEPVTEPTTKPSITKPKPSTTKPTTPKVEETTPPTEPAPTTPETPADPEPDATIPPESAETTQSSTVLLGRYKLTAYCPCAKCCGKWTNQTATGVTPKQGRTIAVDPKIIPYGSKVIINGHTYIAEDCGGAIKGNRIDVFFDSHSVALQFGVQYADVYLVK